MSDTTITGPVPDDHPGNEWFSSKSYKDWRYFYRMPCCDGCGVGVLEDANAFRCPICLIEFEQCDGKIRFVCLEEERALRADQAPAY